MLSLNNLAQSGIGRITGNVSADVSFNSVSIDSRTIAAGDVFVAIKGEQFDGHDFLESAVERGAAALVVSNSDLPESANTLPCLVVEDTTRALGLMAKAWLGQFNIKKAAITGSCGKTTVKELVGGIFSEAFEVLMTQGNFNNDIGLPLTLFRLKPEHQVAVLELGANHVGEIAWTAGLVSPDVSVITNVGQAHLEGFGSVEGIFEAKSEIYDALPDSGVAVINLDDHFAPQWLKRTQNRKQLSFSIFNTKRADISLEQARYVPGKGSFMSVKTPQAMLEIKTQLLGEHNWANVLAAIAVAVALDVPSQAIIQGVAKVKPYSGRLEMMPAKYPGWMLINDTYNANPTSTRIAIDLLATSKRPRVLVLGNMAELGTETEALHRQVGLYAHDHGIDQVIAIGPHAEAVTSGFGGGISCCEMNEVLHALEQYAGQDCSVLVKGSRSAAMERVIHAFADTAV